VPTFNHASHVHLICGSYGPFRAGLPLNVPIWVAINLRQKKTCRILAPDWMAVDKLNERIEEEKASKCVNSYTYTVRSKPFASRCAEHYNFSSFRFFTPLPTNYYLEITQMLLDVASEDIPQGNEIKTAVKVRHHF
jgi:GINS complex subunit 2